MVDIVCYGGVGEVGGNRILVEDGRSRIFLDFGKSFSQEKQYFDEPYIAPRQIAHLKALNLLPPLDGLYDGDDGHYSLDGVLISHAHVDHYDSARMLKEEYPIYLSPISKALLLAREYSTMNKCLGNFGSCTKTDGKSERANIFPLSPGKPQPIGGIQATVTYVDHSVPGAVGTILETSEGCIAYTGDIRLHGRAQSDTKKFIDQAAKSAPELLLIEGTHIGDSRVESEEEVEDKIEQTVRRAKGLVMAGFSMADAQRLSTFYEVAKKTDRTLVVAAKQAFIASELYRQDPALTIDIGDPRVEIFFREKKGNTYSYEEELRSLYPNKIVTSEDVRKSQESRLLVASLYDMNDVAKIKPEIGSVYIHSSSEPFEEEMEINYEKLHNWLEFMGVPLVQIHASGHAGPFDLKAIVQQIQPKKVVPIHTNAPVLFKKFMSDTRSKVVLPEVGKPIKL